MKNLILVFAISLLLQTPLQDDTSALVYFYRTEEVGKFMYGKPKVRINGTVAAAFPESEFIGFKLKPGRYVISMAQSHTPTPLVLEAGKTYYVQVSYKPQGDKLIEEFIIRDENQAALDFEKLKSALEDKNIKDKTLALVREKPPISFTPSN
jgi:hypothetical protein